jgi:hypothetical protein
VPHNQQQNQSERKVRDVKKRTILTLRNSNAPLLFWCFSLIFIVDCLNHTAVKTLGWRTPKEKEDGHTPGISAFRFKFWEPVWYYEPTAKHPAPNFLPGRFVGIAWDNGDTFTYKVWTTPNDKWKDQTKLIRNVVQSRDFNAVEPRQVYSNQDLTLVKRNLSNNPTKRSKRRSAKKMKRGANAIDTIDEIEDGTSSKRVRFDSGAPQTYEPRGPEEQGGNESIRPPEPTNIDSTNQDSSAPSTTAATSYPGRTHDQFEEENPTLDIDPFEAREPYEMTNEINDWLSVEPSNAEVGGARKNLGILHGSAGGPSSDDRTIHCR